jgi:hypothetical protein
MRRIPNKLDREKVYKKWTPIIENHLKFKNDSINNIICLYCEWFASDDSVVIDSLPDALMTIKEKVDNFDRIEILGKYFNPASGCVEYKLKNGNFIKLKDCSYELSNEQLIELFGIDFIRELDPQKFRDNQLDKIL